jgi:hypothetical protein
MKRVPPLFFVAASARWAACGVAALLLWRAGAWALPSNGQSLFLLGASVAYTACWTWLLRRWHARVRDGSLLFFYDLVLSALPMWLNGGWRSAFLPVALGALVVPALHVRWRNGLLAAASFTVLDQAILWSTPTTPWHLTQTGQAGPLVVRTLLPYGMVLLLTAAVRVGVRAGRRSTRRKQPAARASRPLPPLRQNIPPVGVRAGNYGRSATSSATTQTLSAVQAQRPATVRRTATNLQTMLRQLRGELDAAGVTVTLRVNGDDTTMPPQIKTLVLHALEVAVDNVVAHAHAKTVAIVVEIDRTAAHVEVMDDGVGLWDGTAEPPGYHQIKRLRYRVEEVGGALRVEERPDGGVAVRMQVPLDTQAL